MDQQTAAHLLKDAGFPAFETHLWKAELKPFYSPFIYDVTFGDQDADLSEYIKFMQEHGVTKRKKVVELFGGTAFESAILHKKFPGNKYFSVDYNEEYQPGSRHIVGVTGDIFKKEKLFAPDIDLMFIGNTNKSLCSVKDITSLTNTFKFAQIHLKRGGHFIVSSFDDTGFDEYCDFKVEYDIYKIKHHPQFKGRHVHWGMITKRDPAKGTHWYYPMVIITKKADPINDMAAKDRILNYYTPWEPEMYKSWPYFVVAEIGEMNGFKLINASLHDSAFMVFQKI